LSDQILIRPVQPADFPQWKILWDGYNAFYDREGATALPEATTNITWSRFFDAYEPMHALVADCAGELLGLVHFIFHRSTISIAPTCYLQDLFALESARGKGVGRALIEQVYRKRQTNAFFAAQAAGVSSAIRRSGAFASPGRISAR
jgi:GNAT superfamily N-acetyltransferase